MQNTVEGIPEVGWNQIGELVGGRGVIEPRDATIRGRGGGLLESTAYRDESMPADAKS